MSKKSTKKDTPKLLRDDGRTVADMNVEGFGWYTPNRKNTHGKTPSVMDITPSERGAMIRGGLLAVLPVVFAFIGIFAAIFIFIYLWLG